MKLWSNVLYQAASGKNVNLKEKTIVKIVFYLLRKNVSTNQWIFAVGIIIFYQVTKAVYFSKLLLLEMTSVKNNYKSYIYVLMVISTPYLEWHRGG